MKIAIIVAMGKEMELLLPLIEDVQHVSAGYSGGTAWQGRVGRHTIVLTQCGIGKVNAALAADALLREHQPDLVLNSGVAGALGHKVPVLGIVVADRVAYHDVWCGPGTDWGEAAGCPLYFEATSMVSQLPALTGQPDVYHGLLCSGDIFVSGVETTHKILDRFPEAIAVDMESGALAQTCLRHNVPFCCIRVISDSPDEDNANIEQYEDFWKDAPRHTFEALTRVIDELPE